MKYEQRALYTIIYYISNPFELQCIEAIFIVITIITSSSSNNNNIIQWMNESIYEWSKCWKGEQITIIIIMKDTQYIWMKLNKKKQKWKKRMKTNTYSCVFCCLFFSLLRVIWCLFSFFSIAAAAALHMC